MLVLAYGGYRRLKRLCFYLKLVLDRFGSRGVEIVIRLFQLGFCANFLILGVGLRGVWE